MLSRSFPSRSVLIGLAGCTLAFACHHVSGDGFFGIGPIASIQLQGVARYFDANANGVCDHAVPVASLRRSDEAIEALEDAS